MTAVSLHSRQI